ncbi:hypothetical protein M3Y98_00900800 [Aphelenchoides besseyi]|nr:hypothetical protein M3Y98_00900800 [Aphelenchoides besseyi]
MPTKRYRAQSRGRRVISRGRPNARPIFAYIPSDSSNSNAEDAIEQPPPSKDRQNLPARRASRSIQKPRAISGEKKQTSISHARRSASRYSNSRSGSSHTNSIELSDINGRQKSNQPSTSYIVTVDLLVNGRPVKGEIWVKVPVEKLPPSVQLVGLKIDRQGSHRHSLSAF